MGVFAFATMMITMLIIDGLIIREDRKRTRELEERIREREAHALTRHQRDAVEEQGNVDDVMKLLNGKCVDKAPNCNQELCQKYNISLWKKCKKTCGDCNPMVKMATRNPKEKKLMVNL